MGTLEQENALLRENLARARGECLEDGCTEPANIRGRCRRHYKQFQRSDAFHYAGAPDVVNPLVCDCSEPVNPSAIGECQQCFRPVVAMMSPRAIALGLERRAAASLVTSS